MKLNWDDAPEWARFLAMDEDGEWYWYENEPIIGLTGWARKDGKAAYAGESHWRHSLKTRPE